MILTASTGTFITYVNISKMTGEPFVFPTDTVYGIGAPLSNESANRKIFELKKRELSKPLPILAGDIRQVEQIASLPVDGKVADFLNSIWRKENYASCVTVILNATERLRNTIYTRNGTIAIRIVRNGWLKEALELTEPVTATSINESGKQFINDINSLQNEFSDRIKYILKGQTGNSPSDIYDLTENEVIKIR